MNRCDAIRQSDYTQRVPKNKNPREQGFSQYAYNMVMRSQTNLNYLKTGLPYYKYV